MKVKITLTNGQSMTGNIEGEEMVALKERGLSWILNDERRFFPFIQPNGKEVQLQKGAIAMIAEEID